MKPLFEYQHALTELSHKVAGDPSFAIVKTGEVTTAVTAVLPSTERQPAKPQLVVLLSEDNRPANWEPGMELKAPSMPKDWYPSDCTRVIWPDGVAAQGPHVNAPHLGRLSFYLRQHVQTHVSFEPLYQPDMFAQLQQLRGRLRGMGLGTARSECADGLIIDYIGVATKLTGCSPRNCDQAGVPSVTIRPIAGKSNRFEAE